jgi:hypothetical protein
MKQRWHFVMALIVAFVACLCLLAVAHGSKRLILKDGSFQPTSKWEVKGDRVRYWSTERAEWEEVPNSMVDWDATNRWEGEQSASREKELREKSAEEDAETAKFKANTAEVAPGVNLPEQGGVWALDSLRGKAGLEELAQSSGELNKQTTKNILRSVINPLPSSKQTIELKGPKSKVQLHTLSPAIFINVEDLPPQSGQPVDRFRIVRLKAGKTSRVVMDVKVGLTGTKQSEQFVDSRLAKFSGDWVKLVPAQPLQPGEYAVLEMLTDRDVNSFVWDFGIDPTAAESGTQWKKEQ